MKSARCLLVLFLVAILPMPVFPCTGVFIDKGNMRLFGRTMDWKTGDCNVVVNERGTKNKAIYLQDNSKPAEWTTKYGSVTFNMMIKFNLFERIYMWMKGLHSTSGPSCGLNEKGLYGGVFWIHPPPAVKYPADDGKPSMNDWQVLGYLLDTSASVKEALENLKKVRVSGFKEAGFEVDQHWMIADRSGDCAVIEFPDGKLKVHRPPVPPVITNSFYEHSRDYLKQFKGFGGRLPIPLDKGEMTSENRFLFASYMLLNNEKNGVLSFSDVFNIMKSAVQTNVRHAQTSQSVTQWIVVYDLNKRHLSWFSRKTPRIKSIDIGRIDFSASGKTRKIDCNSALSGDVTTYLK